MSAAFIDKNKGGFTLIELMIVIAIIGILAAIAIPQFTAYRTRSYNSSANADLRNLATAQEAYYADHQSYCNSVGRLSVTYGAITSRGVHFQINSAYISTYNMISWHDNGDLTYFIRGPGRRIDHL